MQQLKLRLDVNMDKQYLGGFHLKPSPHPVMCQASHPKDHTLVHVCVNIMHFANFGNSYQHSSTVAHSSFDCRDLKVEPLFYSCKLTVFIAIPSNCHVTMPEYCSTYFTMLRVSLLLNVVEGDMEAIPS